MNSTPSKVRIYFNRRGAAEGCVSIDAGTNATEENYDSCELFVSYAVTKEDLTAEWPEPSFWIEAVARVSSVMADGQRIAIVED